MPYAYMHFFIYMYIHVHEEDTTYNSCVRIPTVNICVVVFRVGIYIPVAYWMSSLPCSPVYTYRALHCTCVHVHVYT